ncbi:ATP-binding protein [Flavobacterium sp. ANB]|uniref:ATP-binding protein n=1 Tax=unclassified Flavobacterium TaxID=196869 RepID=UPI0012B91C73|nr:MULTISPECIES: ATP-binding protein [unclassified Flavobacterium]MBF4518713.1 ATP-binding protein [Flavobacterium sp. ANB]MTD67782.1 hypothetical protein [Flavobacterium sp. LC2016-13]
MYLSISNCFKLDEIVKSFEVAYRSHIVSVLKMKYPTISDFSIAINKLNSSFQMSSIVYTHKYKNKLTKIESEVATFYSAIEDCNDDLLNKDYKEHTVPYVSEIIEYVNFFYNDCFKDLSKSFSTIEEFKDYSSKYYLIRNSLSHPASSKIIVTQAKEVVSFIRKQLLNIDDSMYWFVSKKELALKIEEFIDNIELNPLKIHNLDNISFNHKKLICRDAELIILNELIFGKKVGYRKSGSVIIYGYGGIGKTALILDFIYQTIKEIFDNANKTDLDFLLFYTSKEEILTFSETSGKLYINEIKKQIDSFVDFKSKLFNDLNISHLDEFQLKKGLVIIDNFETISIDDKMLFFEFIKQSPRTIQYVLTSRNEEPCEDKIHLKEFKEIESGVKFIDEFITSNNYNVEILELEKKQLIKYSKGNTLILVLSIEMLKNGTTIKEILNDLINIESSNIEIIADFMYKNNIGQAISFLESEGHQPIDMLKVISINEYPIDLYSISVLSNKSISSIEYMCNFLTTKIILEKRGESYSLNEFANKFIFIKYLPGKIEKKEIKQKIDTYQKNLNKELEKLEESKRKVPILQGIMDDWMPKTKIDEIAIASSFALFPSAKDAVDSNIVVELSRIKKEFEKNEKMTSHPYVKFQKARTLQLFLKIIAEEDKIGLTDIISNSYEEAIEATDFYYSYIKNTKSYGSLNWLFGVFLSFTLKDPKRAVRYLEDAVEVFHRLKIKDLTYFKLLNDLCYAYDIIYRGNGDKLYAFEIKKIYNEIVINEKYIRTIDFKYNQFVKKFGKYNSLHLR